MDSFHEGFMRTILSVERTDRSTLFNWRGCGPRGRGRRSFPGGEILPQLLQRCLVVHAPGAEPPRIGDVAGLVGVADLVEGDLQQAGGLLQADVVERFLHSTPCWHGEHAST